MAGAVNRAASWRNGAGGAYGWIPRWFTVLHNSSVLGLASSFAGSDRWETTIGSSREL